MSDNGGEFNNESYWQMNEKLNIEVCTTAMESPFSNYYNLIVAEAMKKTLVRKWEMGARNSSDLGC